MKPVLIVQNCEAESAGSIPDFLREKKIPSTVVHSYLRQPFPALGDISAVINLGCPLSATEYQRYPFLEDLYAFVASVVREDVPYLGICFGGQLLARVLGARVERNPVKEIGSYDVRLTEKGQSDPLFRQFDPSFRVVQWHSDTFRVPFGADLLVEGDDCKNQAFRSGRAVGVQFHLEAGADDMEGWCRAYPEELSEIGKTPEQVVSATRSSEQVVRQNNFRFLDSFFQIGHN